MNWLNYPLQLSLYKKAEHAHTCKSKLKLKKWTN